MLENEKIQGLLLGVGSVVITILMAQGEWDLFDLVVSIIILSISVSFIRRSKIEHKKIVSLFLAITLTSISLSTISIFAHISSNCFLSSINVETYKKACFDINDKNSIYIITKETIRTLKIDKKFPSSLAKELEKIQGIRFTKLEFLENLKGLSFAEIDRYQHNIVKNSKNIRLYYRNQVIWQLMIFSILSLLVYFCYPVLLHKKT